MNIKSALNFYNSIQSTATQAKGLFVASLVFTFVIMTVIAILGSVEAQAQTNEVQSAGKINIEDLVKIDYDIKPDAALDFKAEDAEGLMKGLNSLKSLPTIEVTLSSQYDAIRDREALSEAANIIAKQLMLATEALANMKTTVYKLSLALNLLRIKELYEQRAPGTIAQHQKIFEKHYHKMLEAVGGEKLKSLTSLSVAASKCFTAVCTMDIYAAQIDLLKFSHSINHYFDIGSRARWQVRVYPIKSEVVLSVAKKTFTVMTSTNKEGSIFARVAQTAVAPFAALFAATGTAVGETVRFIGSISATRMKLYASAIESDQNWLGRWLVPGKAYKTAEKVARLENDQDYYKILENLNGGRNFKEPAAGSPRLDSITPQANAGNTGYNAGDSASPNDAIINEIQAAIVQQVPAIITNEDLKTEAGQQRLKDAIITAVQDKLSAAVLANQVASLPGRSIQKYVGQLRMNTQTGFAPANLTGRNVSIGIVLKQQKNTDGTDTCQIQFNQDAVMMVLGDAIQPAYLQRQGQSLYLLTVLEGQSRQGMMLRMQIDIGSMLIFKDGQVSINPRVGQWVASPEPFTFLN